MNFLKEHNVFLKILSLIIALFLWSFVLLSENPIKTQTFSNQVVQEIGKEAIAERGLIMVNTEQPKINLKVTATSKDMANLSASDIIAQIDLSNIQEAGVYYIQPGISVQKTIEGVSFQPRRLQVTIENIVTKEVPVEVTTMNTLAENQLLGELTSSQSFVKVTGAESIVNTVDHALLIIDLENISKNKAQACRVGLYTKDDALINSELVKPEFETLDVTIGLNQVKEINLNVFIKETPTLTKDLVNIAVAPEKIRVYGSEEALSKVDTLDLGTIDLSSAILSGNEYNFPIKLPYGVSLMAGEPKVARVKVAIKDGITKPLKVTDIRIVDEASSESNKIVYLENSELDIEVEGKANIISSITSDNFHVLVNVNSEQMELGQQMVQCQIVCDVEDVKIVRENPQISVIVMQKEEDNIGS